jgi:hypothetical protein
VFTYSFQVPMDSAKFIVDLYHHQSAFDRHLSNCISSKSTSIHTEFNVLNFIRWECNHWLLLWAPWHCILFHLENISCCDSFNLGWFLLVLQLGWSHAYWIPYTMYWYQISSNVFQNSYSRQKKKGKTLLCIFLL